MSPRTPETYADDINAGAAVPIAIGENVFVGMEALVLKGVTIGERAGGNSRRIQVAPTEEPTPVGSK